MCLRRLYNSAEMSSPKAADGLGCFFWLPPLIPEIIFGQSVTSFQPTVCSGCAGSLLISLGWPLALMPPWGSGSIRAQPGPEQGLQPPILSWIKSLPSIQLQLCFPYPLQHSLFWIKHPAQPGWCVILEKDLLLGSAFLCQPMGKWLVPGGEMRTGVVGLEEREKGSPFPLGLMSVGSGLWWVDLCLVEIGGSWAENSH